MQTKERRYRELVEQVSKKYPTHQMPNSKEMRLEWCELCQEINLWTYWQGRGHLDTTKILLVGQDWGCAFDGKNDCMALPRVERMNNYEEVPYISEDNESMTNKNLIELFKELGYKDICQGDSVREENKDLFFTNLITGYRNIGTSGNIPKKCLDEECCRQFCELVDILQPEIIICLGKYTYDGVLKSLNLPYDKRYKDFNLLIEKAGNEPIEYSLQGRKVLIFPVAHCGSLGVLNRARNTSEHTARNGMELQKADWRRIKKYSTRK